MRGKLRWLPRLGVLLLAIGCLSSCWQVVDGEFGGTGIRLAIEPAGRSVVVTDFEVSSVIIQVIDPGGWMVYEYEWFPEDGWWGDLIALGPDGGEHELHVTHLGVFEGEVTEAWEMAIIDVRPMFINVVSIVPGMVGTIDVDPGDGAGGGPTGPSDPPALDARLFGTWEGWTQMPGPGGEMVEMWSVMNFTDTAYAEVWNHTEPGAPPLDDASMSGWYECDGTNIWGEWTHMWYYGEFHEMNYVTPWNAAIFFGVDSFRIEVDFEPDGITDMTMDFTRSY